MTIRSQTNEATSIAASEFVWNEMGLTEIHSNIQL